MSDVHFMRRAVQLARRGCGATSPNPMVGAVLVKTGKLIGCGWHRRAGGPHAEIEALHDAQRRGHNPQGATLYVTLEPCCTQGRTPPCTEAIIAAGIKRVVVGTIDPNPKHSGKAFRILKRTGIEVVAFGKGRARRSVRAGLDSKRRRARSAAPHQQLADECAQLNEAFNHWIVQRTPFVTVKAAMTLDGKIATAAGESKWITGEKARSQGMKLRQRSDAILVGVNTILADDPNLTARSQGATSLTHSTNSRLRRFILDSMARTPLKAKVVSDDHAALTTVVVSKFAPKSRVAALTRRVRVWVAPTTKRSSQSGACQRIDLRWLLRKLGSENVTSLLVEGGGEVNASFLLGGFVHRVVFFYAPKVLGGRNSCDGVAGNGVKNLSEVIRLREIAWRKTGDDLMLTARVVSRPERRHPLPGSGASPG